MSLFQISIPGQIVQCTKLAGREPCRFETFVGNRVLCIIEQVAPSQWNHVNGAQNPADYAS